MKKLSVIALCALISCCGQESRSLVVVIKKNDKQWLKRVSLELLNPAVFDKEAFSVNSLPEEEIEVSDQEIDDIKALSDQELQLHSIEELYKRSKDLLEKKKLFAVKIADLNNEYFVFALKNSEGYEAYIISDSAYDLIMQKLEDQELDAIAAIIGDERMELPKIPLPPVVTRALVSIAMYAILTYHYVKDSYQSICTKIKTALDEHAK